MSRQVPDTQDAFTPFTREGEKDAIAALKLTTGAKVAVTFRVAETVDHDATQWERWIGCITSQVVTANTTKYTVEYPNQVDPNVMFYGTLPVETEFELAAVERMRTTINLTDVMRKRPR